MSGRPFIVLLAAALSCPVFVTVSGSGASAAPAASASQLTERDRVETGRRLYERHKCATCHQIDGRGNSRFPLDGVAERLTSEDLRRWLTETARMEAAQPKLPAIRMSAMKYRFNAGDLGALVEYLRTLK